MSITTRSKYLQGPTRNPHKGLGGACCSHPPFGHRIFDPFHFPEVIKKLQVLDHRVWIENRIQRRIDFVLQRKHVPTDFTLTVLEHAGVKASKNVWRILLGI
jgi:hypothetical protein